MLPDVWIRLPRHKWPKSWMNIRDPVGPLARNLYGYPLATQFEEIPLQLGCKSTELGMSICSSKTRMILICKFFQI